jgi:hypothetical protein
VLTEIVDEGNLLDGHLQRGGPFRGFFSSTSTATTKTAVWHLLDQLVEMRDSAGEMPPSRRRQTGYTARQLLTNP